MRLFVYGTLCDADVRTLVLGGLDGVVTPASLRGYTTVRVIGAKYPALRLRAAGCALGLILSGIDFYTLTRISHYESGEYHIVHRQPIVPGHGPVDVSLFLSRRGVALSQRRWTLQEWQRRHKIAALSRIGSWMAQWRPGNPTDARGMHFACRRVERASGINFSRISD